MINLPREVIEIHSNYLKKWGVRTMTSFSSVYVFNMDTSQSAFTWSKLTTETLEQGVKYVQS